ncbi:MAG: UDP-N-acetylglucosamine 2-epimerase (hydrolyzing) [Gammaproteobacteria bacterium]|nr:UDP-N-acetylglucosamine 2-epimerase (hydrolyzing) [Gammaproteobacteria bacterium]
MRPANPPPDGQGCLSVGVITTSRADFGHIIWPVRKMQEHPDITPFVIAMGAHLSPRFGYTLDAFRDHHIDVDETLESLISSDTDTGMAKTIGVSMMGLADILSRRRPDVLMIIADRYEMLAAAAAAMALRIPIAHIEGGEISEGAIDDAVRNALTKLSHLHFVPHKPAAQRVIAMGEEPWRVHTVGAPSLDHLRHRELMPFEALAQSLGIDARRPYDLISFHPVTLMQDTVAEAEAFYAALKTIDGQKIFCFPNSDAGSHTLIKKAQEFAAPRHDAHIFTNLDHWVYWNLLHRARAIIGNSSSALMEAPSVPLPAINVGRRQRGRLMAKNVIDCAADRQAIQTAYRRAVSDDFRNNLSGMRNPYGDGHAGERICAALTQYRDRARLLDKRAQPVIAVEDIVGFKRK